jgi:hypothetical protein
MPCLMSVASEYAELLNRKRQRKPY